MILLHCLAESLLHHVGIDLRGRDVVVSEHRLHRAQIRPIVQQMRCERMAQHVRRHPRWVYARRYRRVLDLLEERITRQVPGFRVRREKVF